MKRFLAIVLMCSAFSLPALAADVGVSVRVGEPGFYGRIDIGTAPKPRVIYREPVVVYRERVVEEPIYLRVPPGHAKHWKKHCAEYGACYREVYFVEDDWYETVYVPHYHEHYKEYRGHGRGHHGDHHDHGHGHGRGHGKH